MGRQAWTWVVVALLLVGWPALVAAQNQNEEETSPAERALRHFESRLTDESTRASSNINTLAQEASSRISSYRGNGEVKNADRSTKRARALLLVQSELAIRRAAVHRRLGMAALIGTGATPTQIATLVQRSLSTTESIRQARRQALAQIREAQKTPANLTTVDG